MTKRSIMVGMAEIHVVRSDDAHFSCVGLGSSVAVCAIDPQMNVGGMIQVMLPESPGQGGGDKLGKFADTGITELFSRMEGLGASLERIHVAVVGGAQVMFCGSPVQTACIGVRNAEAVSKKLEEFNVRPVGADLGGSAGRTVQFDVESGCVRITTVQQGERELCNLRVA